MLDASNTRGRWRRIAPKPVSVTWRSHKADDTFASYTLRAQERKLSKQELAIVARLPHRYRGWRIWAEFLDAATAIAPASLPVPEPKPGDQLVGPDGVVWVVSAVPEIKLFGNVLNILVERGV